MSLSGVLEWSVLHTIAAAFAGILFTLLFLGLVVFRGAERRQAKRTSGKVVGIVGRMGTGKSYLAVSMAYDRLRQGVDVASNFKLDVSDLGGRWAPFSSLDQLAELKNCVVIIDEAHLMLPSHLGAKLPMIARQALAHARKQGLDVYWISQHETRVAKVLRDLTSFIVKCEKVGSWHIYRTYDADEYGRADAKSLRWQMTRRKRRIMALYDTAEIIDIDDYALQGDASADEIRRQRDRRRAAGA